MLEILKRGKPTPRATQSGMSLVSVLVALGMISIGFVAINKALLTSLVVKYTLNTDENISVFRSRIISSLANAATLDQIMQLSPGMACEVNRTDCAGMKSVASGVTVVGPDGSKLTDPGNAKFGFNRNGSTCTTYDAAAGDDTCPFRFDVTWKPICPPSGACTNPQNRFKGTFSFKGKNLEMNAIKMTKFNFDIIPSHYNNSLEDNCAAMKGTFNPVSGSCQLPLEGLCPAGQVVTSVDRTTNQKICGYLFQGVCAPGQKIQGVDALGNLTCVAITTCPKAGTDFNTWIEFDASGGDGGDGGDGCDGSDGCGGGS